MGKGGWVGDHEGRPYISRKAISLGYRNRATTRDRTINGRGVIDGIGVLQGVGEAEDEDETFEEGVAGESVGAVYTGAGDFADGVKGGKGGASVGIDDEASYGIVGSRDDWK